MGGAAPRRLAQHHIARLVPEPVVHLLEVVEIEEQHGKMIARAVAARDLVGQPVAQHAERRQAGQRVHRRLLLRQRGLALEIAGARFERRPPLCRRDGKLLARRIAARARVPGPAVRREPDQVDDLVHQLLRRLLRAGLDREGGADLDLDPVGQDRRQGARRLGRPHDGAPAEQLFLGAEQRVIETPLAGQDIDETQVDPIDPHGPRDAFEGA